MVLLHNSYKFKFKLLHLQPFTQKRMVNSIFAKL